MNALKHTLLAVALAAAAASACAQTEPAPVEGPSPPGDLRYAQRVEPRFLNFAGSSENLANMTTGMRSGTEFTITGGGEMATIVPPTRPMGYGNITRALDLANRDLLAHGITDPTPTQIAAALNGGAVTMPDGTTAQMSGVLNLRSQGMGWGQVAHSLSLHPGLGSGKSVPAVQSGMPTSAGSTGAITTALGTRVTQPGVRHAYGRSVSSNGSVGTSGSASGAVTAGGGRASANGSIARGNGNGYGRGGKN